MSSRCVAEISSVRRDRDTNLFCIITFINQPFETSWPRSTTRRLACILRERGRVCPIEFFMRSVDLPSNAMPQESVSRWSKFITLADEKPITVCDSRPVDTKYLFFRNKWVAVKKNRDKYLAQFCFYRKKIFRRKIREETDKIKYEILLRGCEVEFSSRSVIYNESSIVFISAFLLYFLS